MRVEEEDAGRGEGGGGEGEGACPHARFSGHGTQDPGVVQGLGVRGFVLLQM